MNRVCGGLVNTERWLSVELVQQNRSGGCRCRPQHHLEP